MAEKTIIIKGDPVRLERNAAAAVTPGMLVELTSSDTVQAHSTAGGSCAPVLIALEDENQGKGIGDAYSTGNVVLFAAFKTGDVANMLLADGETVVIGTKVESYGDGYLRAVDTDASVGEVGVQSIVGTSLEALDFSGSSAVDPASQRFNVLIA